MSAVSSPTSQKSEAPKDPRGVASSSAPFSCTRLPPPYPCPHLTCLSVCRPVRQKKQRQWIGPTGMNQSSKCPGGRASLSPTGGPGLCRNVEAGMGPTAECRCSRGSDPTALVKEGLCHGDWQGVLRRGAP